MIHATRPHPLLSVLLSLLALSLTHAALQADCGASGNPTGSPIGGGTGYRNLVDPADADYYVSTWSALHTALSSATSGQLIYIDDAADIDMTGHYENVIPAGVTLASGRGRAGSPGARLHCSGLRSWVAGKLHLFVAGGDNVRVTGLRLHGPDPNVGLSPYGLCISRFPTPRGIGCRGGRNLEVDNCELSKWSHAAIYLRDTEAAYVHHNYIHHNLRTGLGYGISHEGSATTLIEANKFDANRHSIAGSGRAGQSYEARYNVVGGCATGYEIDNRHAFDMHGSQSWNPPDWDCWAGDRILIHHNDFQTLCQQAVGIRGSPRVEARVYENRVVHPDANQAFASMWLDTCDKPLRNYYVYSNCYNAQMPSDCALPHPDPMSKFGYAGVWTGAGNFGRWYIGDYNGDGKSDIARFHAGVGMEAAISTGTSFISPKLWYGPTALAEWQIADFTGDGRDDLAQVGVGAPFVVYRSSGSRFLGPTIWRTETYGTIDHVRCGDFNADGMADIAVRASDGLYVHLSTGTSFASGVRWTGAGSGSQDWYVGDYDGNGRSDIFRYIPRTFDAECEQVIGSGAQVYLSTGVAFSHSGSWCNEGNDLPWRCPDVVPNGRWFLGDFNGDERTDIFRYMPGLSGAEMYLSNGNDEFVYSGSWTGAGYGDQGWYVGDFDGDGSSDILRYLSGSGVGAGVYLSRVQTVGIDDGDPSEPGLSAVLRIAAEPNPARGSVMLAVQSDVRVRNVRISIHDLGGRVVRDLPVGALTTGARNVVWDGRTADGRLVASGVYLCIAKCDLGSQARKKVVFLR